MQTTAPGGSADTARLGRPQLADAYSRGRGVHGNDALTDCQRRRLWLLDWFTRLADRLRPVRVCCGHWARVCDSESTLTRLGMTAVFLDPPYRHTIDGEENRAKHIYANDKHQDVDALCDEVQGWCLKWGGNKEIRVALCGLEGEYPMLDEAGWDKVAWKSRGGYGNRTNRGKENAARERIWFSPFCIKPAKDHDLFGFAAAGGEVRRG
jgi:DNA adenine methylase